MPSRPLSSPTATDAASAPPPAAISPSPPPPPPSAPIWRAGTLTYTKAGLFMLFTWLLWGDFCYSLMETVWPSILPLILKAHDAPNTVVSLVLVTIPSAMNFILNPIISTASDRHRGRRGRRIPFILFATPFITALLVLLGFSRELATGLHSLLTNVWPALSPATVAIALICVLLVAFRFFELFVSTVYAYLFNDVVPTALMGRFLGFFRVVGSLAGAFFNFFIFKYAATHASWIFLGAALLYGGAFTLMCLRVKEGDYPPPDPTPPERRSITAQIRTWFAECCSHRVFILIFLANAAWGCAAAINPFNVFLATSIGLSLDDFGKVAGASGVLGILVMYPMGVLVDRYHPIRVSLWSSALLSIFILPRLIFLFVDFSTTTTFWIYTATVFLPAPFVLAYAAAMLPLVMRMFPHERFGQFCAANAMSGAAAQVLGGMGAGLFLDLMRRISADDHFYYRYAPVWQAVFFFLTSLLILAIYREWKRLGGDSGYRPPIADKFAAIYHEQ